MVLKRKMVQRSTKYLVLTTLLASNFLGLSGVVEAAEGATETGAVTSRAVTAGVEYVDQYGNALEIAIPRNSQVTINGNTTAITVKFNGQTYTLTKIRSLTLKNLIVTNPVLFNSIHYVTSLTIDQVNFQKGMELNGSSGLENLVIKDSMFGASKYSFSLNNASKLVDFGITNSTFTGDVLVQNNKLLEKMDVTDSLIKGNMNHFVNKKGFSVAYQSNRFERFTGMKKIDSGNKSADAHFFINPTTDMIGESKFDPSTEGTIYYREVNDQELRKMMIPANVNISEFSNSGNKLTMRLSNGNVTVFNDPREFYFRNVDILAQISWANKTLKLEKLTFVNSRMNYLQVVNNPTLQSVEIMNSEVSIFYGFVRFYGNPAMTRFIFQDSVIKGTEGNMEVYNNQAMTTFNMTNSYMYGFLRTYQLGAAPMSISNGQFDYYIVTDQLMEGEAEPQPVGYGPVIDAQDRFHDKGDYFDPMVGVTAVDLEDGDLTSEVVADDSQLNPDRGGIYPVSYTIVDSDGNLTTVTVMVTVG